MTRYATLDLPLTSWDGEHSGVAPATIIHDIAAVVRAAVKRAPWIAR